MILIPGFVISTLTFPGVIVHELGHKYFCDRFGVRVHEVKYFRIGNPAGYVLHDVPDKFYKTFFIDVGPFLMNTSVAFMILFMTSLIAQLLEITSGPLYWTVGFFSWLGFSIAMNAFPSRHDAKVLWAESRKYLSQGNIGAILGFPVSVFIWIANILSFFWFDAVYAILIVLIAALTAGLITGAAV